MLTRGNGYPSRKLYIERKIERADQVIHVCPTPIDDLSRALQGIA